MHLQSTAGQQYQRFESIVNSIIGQQQFHQWNCPLSHLAICQFKQTQSKNYTTLSSFMSSGLIHLSNSALTELIINIEPVVDNVDNYMINVDNIKAHIDVDNNDVPVINNNKLQPVEEFFTYTHHQKCLPNY